MSCKVQNYFAFLILNPDDVSAINNLLLPRKKFNFSFIDSDRQSSAIALPVMGNESSAYFLFRAESTIPDSSTRSGWVHPGR